MILYLPFVSILLTYFIFQSKGIDYRFIAIGSLIPAFIDMFVGHASLGHSFLLPVVLLMVIMLATISRPRLLRRRLLCIPIGMFFALVLTGSFLHEQTWWWPLTHKTSGDDISIFPNTTIWFVREAIGLIALYIVIGIGDLYKKEKLVTFFKDGRIT